MSSPSIGPVRMPYEGESVPHAVIEVNRECDISCTACYKSRSRFSKPLADIKADIDLAAARRRLSMVTLAGGEPSLHPELPAVIAHARGLGLSVQMLSNGYGLTDDKLAAYRAAGLSLVYLHVDSLQHRPDAPERLDSERDLNPLRDALAARVRRQGVHCGVSMTLYRKNLPDIADVVRHVAESPDIDRLLVTCCLDFAALAKDAGVEEARGAGRLLGQQIRNAEVEELLRAAHAMVPFGYVASQRDPGAHRWILYYSFVGRAGGRTRVLHAGPAFGRVANLTLGLSRRLRGRYPFGEVIGPAGSRLLCLLYALAARDGAAFGLALGPRHAMGQKSFVFQEGPVLAATGEVDTCLDCPDATVRDERLVPVCLADVMGEHAPRVG